MFLAGKRCLSVLHLYGSFEKKESMMHDSRQRGTCVSLAVLYTCAFHQGSGQVLRSLVYMQRGSIKRRTSRSFNRTAWRTLSLLMLFSRQSASLPRSPDR